MGGHQFRYHKTSPASVFSPTPVIKGRKFAVTVYFPSFYVYCRYQWMMVLCMEKGFKMLGLSMRNLNNIWNSPVMNRQFLKCTRIIHTETQPISAEKKLHTPVLSKEVAQILEPDNDQVCLYSYAPGGQGSPAPLP